MLIAVLDTYFLKMETYKVSNPQLQYWRYEGNDDEPVVDYLYTDESFNGDS